MTHVVVVSHVLNYFTVYNVLTDQQEAEAEYAAEVNE